MNELGRLRQALRHHELMVQSFDESRNEMRDAVRAYLKSKTVEHGASVGLAKKLGISAVQLSNLKYGHSVPSAEWARNAVRICEGAQ